MPMVTEQLASSYRSYSRVPAVEKQARLISRNGPRVWDLERYSQKKLLDNSELCLFP